MKPARDLVVGDVIKSKLPDDKKEVPRKVTQVKPRTGLTRVLTTQKFDANKREIWELRSELNVTTAN